MLLGAPVALFVVANVIFAGFRVMLGVGFWLDDHYQTPAIVSALFPVALAGARQPSPSGLRSLRL